MSRFHKIPQTKTEDAFSLFSFRPAPRRADEQHEAEEALFSVQVAQWIAQGAVAVFLVYSIGRIVMTGVQHFSLWDVLFIVTMGMIFAVLGERRARIEDSVYGARHDESRF